MTFPESVGLARSRFLDLWPVETRLRSAEN